MINSRGHLSAQSLDLMLMQALSSTDLKAAEAHLATCTECKQQWAELSEDSQKFSQYVFPRTVAKVEARLAPQSFFDRFKLAFVLPALGLATAAVIGVVLLKTPPVVEDENYIGLKGAKPSLEVFALRADSQLFKVKEGAALKAGDKIRFIVGPGTAQYLLIGSQDAKGEFSVFHPFGAEQSQKLDPAGPRRVEVPGSVELDDTVGQERLIAVFSNEPVKADAVKAAVQADPKAPQISGAQVISWQFLKEPK